MNNKKGQGLSLNVIIIAAIALVVLVVLIAIFAGKSGDFATSIGGEAKGELRAMNAFYGDCHPNAKAEVEFGTAYNDAAELDNAAEAETGKAQAKELLQDEIGRCNSYSDKETCDDDDNCKWQ